MERVHAADGLGAAAIDHARDPAAGVSRDMGKQPTALLAEFIEEAPESLLVASLGRPDQPSAVVIDDHDQVLVTLPERDLVDPDPAQALQLIRARLQTPADASHDP